MDNYDVTHVLLLIETHLTTGKDRREVKKAMIFLPQCFYGNLHVHGQ